MVSQPAAAEGALACVRWPCPDAPQCILMPCVAIFHTYRSPAILSAWLLMGHLVPAGAAEEAVEIQEQVIGLHSGRAAVSSDPSVHAGAQLRLCRPHSHAGALHICTTMLVGSHVSGGPCVMSSAVSSHINARTATARTDITSAQSVWSAGITYGADLAQSKTPHCASM